MAYTTGISGDRNIVTSNGNRYFTDRNTATQNNSQKKPQTASNTYTPSKGSGSKGSGSGVATSSGGYDGGMSLLESWYAQQQAAAEAAAAAKQQAAQEAYNRGMAALTGAYDANRGRLDANYQSSLGTLQDSYNQGVNGVNKQADKTQNEAYINYMLTLRDMPQLLAAQGVNGGAAESTLAGMKNNYGTARNEIDSGRNDSLSDLLAQLNANKAAALQAYNESLNSLDSSRMAYQMQLEQALANQIISAANAQYDALYDVGSKYYAQALEIQQAQADAAAKAAAKTYTANNTVKTASTKQGSNGGTSNYNNIAALYRNGQVSAEDAYSQMVAQGLTAAQIQQMLSGYVA